MALWMSSISGLSVSLLRGSNLFPPFLSPWFIFSLLSPPNDLSKITIDLLFLPLPTIENKSRLLYVKSKEIGSEGGWKILFVYPENDDENGQLLVVHMQRKTWYVHVSKRKIFFFSTLMNYLDLLSEFFELEAEG